MELPRKAVLTGLYLYKKVISPLLPPACRFLPTCSEYSYLAISRYGVWRGTALTVKRLCKCHPFHPGGYDPLL